MRLAQEFKIFEMVVNYYFKGKQSTKTGHMLPKDVVLLIYKHFKCKIGFYPIEQDKKYKRLQTNRINVMS